jgi:hypothetical protein
MKYRYLLALLLMVTNNTYSQDYEPMLGDSNIWYVFSCPEGCYTEIIQAFNDTIFNEKKYKMIKYYGFIREDTLSRKVYFKYIYGNRDILWFDFSLEVGDSILLETMINQNIYSMGYYKVDSVSFVNTLLGKKNAIYLRSPPGEYDKISYPVWIEGIGTTGNIVYRGYHPSVENMGELGCLFKDGALVYKSALAIEMNTCKLSGPSAIETANNNIITIYPNPFTDQLKIEELPSENLIIEIYDIFGRLNYQKYINSSPTHNIITDNINSGLYILRITNTDTGKVVTKRIIVKR